MSTKRKRHADAEVVDSPAETAHALTSEFEKSSDLFWSTEAAAATRQFARVMESVVAHVPAGDTKEKDAIVILNTLGHQLVEWTQSKRPRALRRVTLAPKPCDSIVYVSRWIKAVDPDETDTDDDDVVVLSVINSASSATAPLSP